jgi:hypothetical protein
MAPLRARRGQRPWKETEARQTRLVFIGTSPLIDHFSDRICPTSGSRSVAPQLPRLARANQFLNDRAVLKFEAVRRANAIKYVERGPLDPTATCRGSSLDLEVFRRGASWRSRPDP